MSAGGEVQVFDSGRISLVGTPYLYGAGINLAQGVSNLSRLSLVSTWEALEMASLHPARLLAQERRLGTLNRGKLANLIQYSWTDTGIQVHRTVLHGKVVYDKTSC